MGESSSPRVRFKACNPLGSRLRTWWPAEALKGAGWDADCSMRWPEPGEADVVICHRPTDWDDAAAVEAHRAKGAVVLIDEDDDLSDIPFAHGWHPAPEVLARHDSIVGMADGLIVSTPRLAEVYGPLARRTWLLPNRLPRRIGGYVDRVADGKIRVGWAGIVTTHMHDLTWLSPVSDYMVEHAVFETIGDHRTQAALKLRGRIERQHGFTYDEAELYRAMSRADIGIVPLEPHPFNLAKSWLKALEYGTLGIPVVATDLPNQRAFVEHGVSGFLAGTPEEFADHVRTLVDDAELRRRMGLAARERAAEHVLEDHVGGWQDAIAAALASRLAA